MIFGRELTLNSKGFRCDVGAFIYAVCRPSGTVPDKLVSLIQPERNWLDLNKVLTLVGWGQHSPSMREESANLIGNSHFFRVPVFGTGRHAI